MTTHPTEGGWQIQRPTRPLTDAHLMITGEVDHPAAISARSLIDNYRIARTALHRTLGCDGFAVTFSIGWQPSGEGIGEPDEPGHGFALHVFGRRPDESTTPARALAVPRSVRATVDQPTGLDPAIDDAREAGDGFRVPPVPVREECDGCAESVRVEQELWRDDLSRVITAKHPLIGPQVLVLPLRHVVSLGDLRADEVISLAAQLERVRGEFNPAYGSTGLSCFANDGARAKQSTPHVHLHVFGRATDEPVQPLELLARRIGILPS